MKTLLFVALAALACGCKTTYAEHDWGNGQRTVVRDMRFFHRQSAQLSFSKSTNGTVTVSAGVNSGVDAASVEKAGEMAVGLFKLATGVP
jgi:hypothetical protein